MCKYSIINHYKALSIVLQRALIWIGLTLNGMWRLVVIVNINNAKTNFSKLVEEVMNGGEVIIAKAGKPVAKLVSITLSKPKRKPGALKGKIKIADDFDSLLPV